LHCHSRSPINILKKDFGLSVQEAITQFPAINDHLAQSEMNLGIEYDDGQVISSDFNMDSAIRALPQESTIVFQTKLYSMKEQRAQIKKSYEERLSALETDNHDLRTDLLAFKTNCKYLTTGFLYPLLIRELIKKSKIDVLKMAGYEVFDEYGNLNQQTFSDSMQQLRNRFNQEENHFMDLLAIYSKDELQFLLTHNQGHLHEVAHPDLKENEKCLEDAIKNEKTREKTILQSLFLKVKAKFNQ